MKIELWIKQPGNRTRLKEKMFVAGMGKYPIVSDKHHEQAYYEILMDEGQEDWLARMFIKGPPGLKGTDGAFFEGEHANEQLRDEGIRDRQVASLMRHRAKKAGVSIKGKRYIASIADYTGDPKAWVSDRAEAQRKLEARWARKAKKAEIEESQPKRLAPDIVRDLMEKELAANPHQRRMDVEEKVRKKHGGDVYKSDPIGV